MELSQCLGGWSVRRWVWLAVFLFLPSCCAQVASVSGHMSIRDPFPKSSYAVGSKIQFRVSWVNGPVDLESPEVVFYWTWVSPALSVSLVRGSGWSEVSPISGECRSVVYDGTLAAGSSSSMVVEIVAPPPLVYEGKYALAASFRFRGLEVGSVSCHFSVSQKGSLNYPVLFLLIFGQALTVANAVQSVRFARRGSR